MVQWRGGVESKWRVVGAAIVILGLLLVRHVYDTSWECLVSFNVLGMKNSRIIVGVFYYIASIQGTQRGTVLMSCLSQRGVS